MTRHCPSLSTLLAVCALASGAISLSLPGAAGALQAPAELDDLDESDEAALETIATHPSAVRDAVLRASLHVDALVETQRIQDQTSAAFRDRIASLARERQEQMWEVVREPGLLEELATDEPPSASQLEAIAARHPEVPAPAIRELGAQDHALLVEVAGLQRAAHERFEAVLEGLPEPTQEAFRALVEQPELLTLLASQVRLVVHLGDSYRADPEVTRAHLDALSAEVAQRNREAQEQWVEAIDADPQAAEELAASARVYADENGYDYEDLTGPSVRTTVNVVVRPYPYWFGYPLWYSNLYFYPYGYWYPYPLHFGFYTWGGSAFFFGLPSVGYLSWYFGGHYPGHYGHLSDCFARYGGSHPHARTHANTAVQRWAGGSNGGRHRGGSFGSSGRASPNAHAFAEGDHGDFFVRRSSWDRGAGGAQHGDRWRRERSSSGSPGPAVGRSGERGEGSGFTREAPRRERAPGRAAPESHRRERASRPGSAPPARRDQGADPPRSRRAPNVIVHRGNEGAPRDDERSSRAAPVQENARARDRSDRGDRSAHARERQRIEVRGPAVSDGGSRARPTPRAVSSGNARSADRRAAPARRFEIAPMQRGAGPRVPAPQPGRGGGARVPDGPGGHFGMRGRH